jgi:hypothetical protein
MAALSLPAGCVTALMDVLLSEKRKLGKAGGITAER